MRKLLLILLPLLLCACQKTENLYCTVQARVELPDGANAISITIDPSLEGNRFQNINTLECVPFPVFVNNAASLRVLKGLYTVAFDGEALFADGTTRKVRCTAHNTQTKSVTLTADSQELVLPVTYLK